MLGERKHKRTHCYERFGIGKSIHNKVGKSLPRLVGWWEKWRVITNWYEVSFWSDEKCPKINCSDGCITVHVLTNTTLNG